MNKPKVTLTVTVPVDQAEYIYELVKLNSSSVNKELIQIFDKWWQDLKHTNRSI